MTESNTYGIAAVERETGLGKDTLRVWERRYGFPTPQRDAQGERAYSRAQLDKLRVLKRLLDAGHRPGQLMALSIDELQQVGQRSLPDSAPPDTPAGVPELDELMALLRGHDLAALRRQLRQAQVRLGLSAFVTEVVAPFNTLVGDAWMRGTLDIYQEHCYTEAVQRALRAGIQGLPEAAQGPRIVFSTLPGEPHGIGLLMAEAICAAEGASCLSLGVQTPAWELVLAAKAYAADVLALSFTPCLGVQQVVAALHDLRARLPEPVQIWAGGSAPALKRREVAGVTRMNTLAELPDALQRWRAQHPD